MISQDPPEQVIKDCTAEVSEVVRVLKPASSSSSPSGGIFLYLTFGQPHFRKRYLVKEETTLEVREMGDMFHYYLYIVRKERL